MVIGEEAETTDVRRLKDGTKKKRAANCALMRQLGKKKEANRYASHTQWETKTANKKMNKMRTNYTIRVSVTIYSTTVHAVAAASHHTPQSELSSRNAWWFDRSIDFFPVREPAHYSDTLHLPSVHSSQSIETDHR